MDNHSSSLVNHLQTGNSYHSYVRYGEWEYITENLVNVFVDIVRMYFCFSEDQHHLGKSG